MYHPEQVKTMLNKNTLFVFIFQILLPSLCYDLKCEELNSMLLNHFINGTSLPEKYKDAYKLIKHSGSGLNDLGDYYSCKLLPYGHYIIIQLKVADFAQSIGLCFFNECSYEYVNNSLMNIYDKINKTIPIPFEKNAIQVINPDNELELIKKKFFIPFLVSIIILAVLVSLGLFTYIFNCQRLSYFNIGINLKKIFHIDKNQNNTFKCLRIFDGIRFYSCIWIIFGHSCMFPILYGIKNIMDFPRIAKKWSFCFLSGAFYAVDVFFYASGFMLNLTFHKNFPETTKNNFSKDLGILTKIIINRYLRLLPFYILIIFGFTYIFPYLTSGPIYYNISMFNKGCQKNSWHNLLYINNLINYGDKDPMNVMCGGHTWYLANDMQFFLLSILIMFAFRNIQIVKHILFCLVFLSSCIYQMYTVIINKYTYWDFVHLEEGLPTNFFLNFYIKPFPRIGPYIIGIFFCELLFHTDLYQKDYPLSTTATLPNIQEQDINNQKDPKKEQLIEIKIASYSKQAVMKRINQAIINNKFLSFALLILSLILINSSFITSCIGNHYKLSPWVNGYLHTFNKNFFTLGLAIIVHLTFLHKLVFVQKLLTFRIMTPVSRVSYGIYLVHIYFISLFCTSYNNYYYINIIDLSILSLGVFVLSWLTSLVLGLIIESPVIALLRRLPKNSVKQNKL